jgi:hypothetical protein
MDLPNCTEELQTNCQNFLTKCPSCIAGYGNKHLYSPIEDLPHPYIKKQEEKKKVKAKYIKAGLKKETAIVKSAQSKIRNTIRSGALNGDGDISLKTPTQKLALDSKVKHTTKQNFVITPEWVKTLENGTMDGYILTNKNPDTKQEQTVVVLSEDSLYNLISNFNNE